MHVTSITARPRIAQREPMQVVHTQCQSDVLSIDGFAARAFRGAQLTDVVVASRRIECGAIAQDPTQCEYRFGRDAVVIVAPALAHRPRLGHTGAMNHAAGRIADPGQRRALQRHVMRKHHCAVVPSAPPVLETRKIFGAT